MVFRCVVVVINADAESFRQVVEGSTLTALLEPLLRYVNAFSYIGNPRGDSQTRTFY